MNNICIFDTETTNTEKPFCYNIGYVIVDTDDGWKTLVKRDFVVEQIWHNTALFNTAYYADKRPIYVAEMRKHNTLMDKYGYICQQMMRDFKAFEVSHAYAYNNEFDDRVFSYNCDWFKCSNPFDTIEIHDIRGFVHQSIIDADFKKFADDNKLYTKSGNYSTTAEDIYRYITKNPTFEEAHTALNDSLIEMEILKFCIDKGVCKLTEQPAVLPAIERPILKELHIRTATKKDFYFKYKKIYINKDKTKITLV